MKGGAYFCRIGGQMFALGDTFGNRYNLLTYLNFGMLSIFPTRIMSNMENKWGFFPCFMP
jgi:hypothetical protein